MKEILKSICKRKMFNLLIFLQFAFAVLYFFITAMSIQSAFNSNIAVNRELEPSPERTIHMEVQEEESHPKNFINFKRDLLKSNMVENFSGWRLDMMESIEDYETGNDSEENYIDCINITKDSNLLKTIDVKDGRYFTDDDYNNKKANGTEEKPFSMIVGSDFAKERNLKAGDSFVDFNENVYSIVGVLEPGSKFFDSPIFEGRIVVMDNAVMAANTGDIIYHPMMHYYSIVKENTTPEEAIESVKAIAQKNDIILSTDLISDELSKVYDESVRENSSWMIFSLVIFALVAIGTSILIVAHMHMRQNEIGIRMAYGYSFKKILFLMWGELFTVAIGSFLFAIVLSTLLYPSGGIKMMSAYYLSTHYLSTQLIIIGAVMFLIMCLPSAFALVYNLKKVQPKDLIGGK